MFARDFTSVVGRKATQREVTSGNTAQWRRLKRVPPKNSSFIKFNVIKIVMKSKTMKIFSEIIERI